MVVVATADPSNDMVTLEEAAKPQPETVTDEPTKPEFGLRTQIGGKGKGLVGEFGTMLSRVGLLQGKGETYWSSRWADPIATSITPMVQGESGWKTGRNQ